MGLHCIIVSIVNVLCYAIVAALCALGLLYLVLKHNSFLQKKFFVYLFKCMASWMKPLLVSFKKQLFIDLDKVESKDTELKKEGLFRLLEIGIGEGTNLAYYPKNCRLISLEPNDSFLEHWEKNTSRYPDLVLEKFVNSVAEDMKDIADNSVDVVVCTHVLCSVTDVDGVFREVRRVLCEDGQFLLLEHIAAPPDTTLRTIQSIVQPVWEVFLGGCHLTRDTKESLQNANFSKVEVETINIPGLPSLFNRHIIGKAVK